MSLETAYENPRIAQMMAAPSGAIFSPCRKYRYLLWRYWGPGRAFAHFCALNPSTADETADDPTIRREIAFAKRFGADGLIKTNLFAFRATDPRDMKACSEPIGPLNDDWIYEAATVSCVDVAAWGVHGTHMGRDMVVRGMCINWKCLGVTKDGHPKHPLYLKSDTPLIELK